MLKTFKLLLVAAVAFTLVSCGNQVRRNALEGSTYQVEDVALYSGTNLATWRNTHEGEEFGEGDLSLDVRSSSGEFDFGDDGEVNIQVTVSYIAEDGMTYEGGHTNVGGTLVMDGRQDWFDVDGGTQGYTQYFIEDKSGRELVIAYEELYGQYGTVYLFKVKK